MKKCLCMLMVALLTVCGMGLSSAEEVQEVNIEGNWKASIYGYGVWWVNLKEDGIYYAGAMGTSWDGTWTFDGETLCLMETGSEGKGSLYSYDADKDMLTCDTDSMTLYYFRDCPEHFSEGTVQSEAEKADFVRAWASDDWEWDIQIYDDSFYAMSTPYDFGSDFEAFWFVTSGCLWAYLGDNHEYCLICKIMEDGTLGIDVKGLGNTEVVYLSPVE